MKKILWSLIGLGSMVVLFFLSSLVTNGISPTRQEFGGTGTSTIFSTNSLILQGVTTPGSAGYKGLATGSNLSILQMSGNIPTWVAPSVLNIASGTSGSIQFAGAGNTFNADQSNLFWDNTNKFLGIGTSTVAAPLNLTAQPANFINFGPTNNQTTQMLVGNAQDIMVNTTNGAQKFPNAQFNYDDTSGVGGDYQLIVAAHGNVDPSLVFYSSKGTSTAPTAVTSGKLLSFIGTRGYGLTHYGGFYSGTDPSHPEYNSDAGIEVYATQNFTDNAHGTEMVLRVTPPNVATPTPAVILNPNDNVGTRGQVAVQGFPNETNPLFSVNPYDGTTVTKELTVFAPGTTTLFSITSTTNATLFQINQNGNIGIGTGLSGVGVGAPNNTLQIFSTSDPEANISTASNWPVVIDNPITTTGSSTGIGFGVTTSAIQIGAGIGFQRQGASTYGDLFFVTRPNGGNPTEQMRIASNGSTTIDSLGTGCVGAVSGQLYIAASNCSSGGGGGGLGTTTPFTAGYIPEATGTNVTLSNSNIFQSTNGNIGIATISPQALLQLSGTTNAPYIILDNRNASTTYPETQPVLVANGIFGGFEMDLRNSTTSATTTLIKLPGFNSTNASQFGNDWPGVAIGYNAGAKYDFSLAASGASPIFIGAHAGEKVQASSSPVNVEARPFGAVIIGDGAMAQATAWGGETTAIGGESLNGLTTGYLNTAVGYDSGLGCTSCYGNTFVGNDTGNLVASGFLNTYVGYTAGIHATGDNNTYLGTYSGNEMQGNNNVAVGYLAGQENRGGTGYNTITGFQAGMLATTSNETIYGADAGYGADVDGLLVTTCNGNASSYKYCSTRSNNSIFGYRSGVYLRGNNNLLMGYQSGYDLQSGSNNIVLGYNTDLPATTTSNTLDIGNLIYGTGMSVLGVPNSNISAGNVGIGTSTPSATLSVSGGSEIDGFFQNPQNNNGLAYFSNAAATSTFFSQALSDDYTINGDQSTDVYNLNYWGQTFTPTYTASVSAVSLYIYQLNAALSGTSTVAIYNTSGTYGTNAIPTSTPLAVSDNFQVSQLTRSPSLINFTFSGANQVTLTSGNHYALVLRYSGADTNHAIGINYDDITVSHSGNIIFTTDGGTTWTGSGVADLPFYVYQLIPDTLNSGSITHLTTTSTLVVLPNGYLGDNSVTPTALFTVQGVSGNTDNVLIVASSTGTSMLSVSQGATTTLTNLNIIGNCIGCGSGSPGGSDTQIQWNNHGTFGGSSNFTYNSTTQVTTLIGSLNLQAAGSTSIFIGGNITPNGNGGNYNVAIGPAALGSAGAGTDAHNIAIGRQALASVVNSTDNVSVGYNSGAQLESGSAGNRNIFLGADNAFDQTDGFGNIIIGAWVDAPSLSGSGQLNIGNAIFGTGLYNAASMSSAAVAANIGIGTTTPAARLSIEGQSGSTTPLFIVATSTNSALFTITSSGLVLTQGTTPTIATSTGIGSTAGSATLSQADSISGLVTFQASTTPAANATIVTITFPVAWANPPNCLLTKATTSPASAFDIWATTTTTTLLIKSTSTAIPASSQTATYYHCFSH